MMNGKAMGGGEKKEAFFKHTGAPRFINATPSAFSMTIFNTLGRGMCVYTITVRQCQQAVARQAAVWLMKKKKLLSGSNIFLFLRFGQ